VNINTFLFKLVMFLLVFISGCGGGTGSNTTSVTLTADKAQAVASQSDAVTITAVVTDGTGVPLGGHAIQFSVPAGTYPLNPPTSTDADGTATIRISHPPVGPHRVATISVTASTDEVHSDPVTVSFLNPQQPPARVTLVADKTSIAAGLGSLTLTATATDAEGRPLAGLANNFDAPEGMFMAGISLFTNEDGQGKYFIVRANEGSVSVPTTVYLTAIINGVRSNPVSIDVLPAPILVPVLPSPRVDPPPVLPAPVLPPVLPTHPIVLFTPGS
jgi:hypothetical protein